MKKIVIIGSGGSGKSTLARDLGKILALPVIHLDSLYWKPNWVETPRDEWVAIQREICSHPKWIVDGNYGGTMEIRLEACDAIVFLDLSRWLCTFRALKRFWKSRGRRRPDMAEGCEERIDWKFLRWVWNYPEVNRPGILTRLRDLEDGKKIHILRNKKEVARFLDRAKESSRLD